MPKTFVCVLAWLLLMQPLAADDSLEASWGRPPRRLENGSPVGSAPISWAMLAFSGDGKILAADGECPRGQYSAAKTKLIGPASTTPVELLAVWDLKTYRSTNLAIGFAISSQVAVRLSGNGKSVYGHSQRNTFQEDVRAKRKGVPGGDNVKAKRGQQGAFYYWPLNERRPSAILIEAAPSGTLLGSHLSSDLRTLLLAKPEGIQAFGLLTKITKPAHPGVPKSKYRVANARGPLAAAPGTFQAPASFSADGSCFISSDENGGMVVWDVSMKQVRCRATAPDEGRAALATISADHRRLFVSAADHGAIHVYDASNGREVGKIDPRGGAATSISTSADAALLAYCAGGRAYIHQLSTHQDRALALEDGASISCIAISPDGLSVAGGGSDGAVRLWEAPRPHEAPLARMPEQSEKPLAALGPRRVTITGANGETKEMWLARLTAGEALLRGDLGGKLLRVSAANGKVIKIAADGAVWQLDTKTHLYAGPTLSLPDLPAIDVAARPTSPAEENLHLLLAARRRLTALVHLSEEPRHEQLLMELRGEIEKCERFLRGRPAPAPAVAALYGDLAHAAGDLAQAASQRTAALDALNEQTIKASHQQAENDDLRVLGALLAGGMMFMGSLTEDENIASVEDGAFRFRPVYRRVLLFPGLMEAGLFHALSEAEDAQRRDEELKALERLGQAAADHSLASALETREKAIKRVQDAWHAVAKADFGLDDTPLDLENLARATPRRAGDSQPLFDALAEQTRRHRGRTTRDDPFDLADLLFLKAESPQADAEKAYRLAQEVSKLVPLVPRGEVYDGDRARLLSIAETLVARAVSLESGNADLCQTYSDKARFAVALVDRALALGPGDPSGQLRERRATALAQCGRVEEALEQGRQLVAQHPDSATANYLLARLECSTGNVGAGLDRLERALTKLGLRDVADVRRRQEFPKSNPRFRSLTEFKLKVVPRMTIANSGTISVANEGVFPLYNVRLRLQYQGKKPSPDASLVNAFKNPGKLLKKEQAPFVSEVALRRLGPGQSYELFTEPGVELVYEVKHTKDGRKSKRWLGGKLIVTAPQQGRKEFDIAYFFTGSF